MTTSQAVADHQTEQPARPERGSAFWVLLSIFVLSGVLGIVAYWRFTRSDRYLAAAFAQIQQRGKALTPEQCIDEVIGWTHRCEAMKSLCEASIPRMTELCLAAADRRDYCASLGQAVRSTEFGVPECRARGAIKREAKKVCALCYRGVATHCELLARRGGQP